MQIRPEGMGVDGWLSGVVPRRRPLFSMRIKLLNAMVCLLTLGKVLMRDVVHFRNWDGILR